MTADLSLGLMVVARRDDRAPKYMGRKSLAPRGPEIGEYWAPGQVYRTDTALSLSLQALDTCAEAREQVKVEIFNHHPPRSGFLSEFSAVQVSILH